MEKHGIELKVIATGASAELLALAEAAAWSVFDSAGADAWDCASAAFKLELEREEISNEEFPLAMLWFQANTTAIETAKSHGIEAKGIELLDVE
jgi:hypothetical protein